MDKLILIFSILFLNFKVNSQINSAFNFEICKPAKYDTIGNVVNGYYRIEFYSHDSTSRIQQTYHDTVLLRSDIFFQKDSPYRSNVFEYYPSGKIKAISFNLNDTLISTEYFENGSRKRYSYGVPDTSSLCFYGKNSYSVHYYQNDMIQMEYQFVEMIKDFNEYWDNGKIKTQGNYLPCLQSYTGLYKEYSSDGKLICTGEYYRDPKDLMQCKSIKIGKWKYYKNGRCYFIESYDKNGDLIYMR